MIPDIGLDDPGDYNFIESAVLVDKNVEVPTGERRCPPAYTKVLLEAP